MFHDRVYVSGLLRVITLRPGQSVSMQLCGDRASHRHCTLHWVKDERRSLPCLTTACPRCDLPMRYVSYVPARVWDNRNQRWTPKIACLGVGRDAVLDHPSIDAVLWRATKGDYQTAEVKWFEEIPKFDLPKFKAFDIVPSLMHMWGMKHADAGLVADDARAIVRPALVPSET